MSKILDLFKTHFKEIGADKTWPTNNDDTPYSEGIDSAGSKNIDEPAIVKLESKRGGRYGLGDLGGGSQNSPGFHAGNKYSDSVTR